MTIPNKTELQAIRKVRKKYAKVLTYVRRTPVKSLPKYRGYFLIPELFGRAEVSSLCTICYIRKVGCDLCILGRNHQQCLAEGSLYKNLCTSTTKKDLIKAIIAIKDYKIQYKSWR